MMRRHRRGGWLIPAFAACFAAGVFTGWWLRGGPPAPAINRFDTTGAHVVDTDPPERAPAPTGSTAAVPSSNRDSVVATSGGGEGAAIDLLRQRQLRVPVDGIDVDRLKGMFAESRDAGGRAHEAVDMLAPRNTPVHAADDGTIAKLFTSKAGGLTIYQFNPSQQFCYYYAHLERYASGLHDGQAVARGDVIGYVGTSGNAPPNTPHLHFAVFELGPEHHWWQGRPLDPYLILRR